MTNMTLEQRYRRKANIDSAEKSNRKYKERCRLHGYIAGKAVYHLTGNMENVSKFPEQEHYHALKCMAESGVELLELHTAWENKEYVERFVALCHYFDIKVIPYLLFEFPETVEERIEMFGDVSKLLIQCGFDGICHDWSENKKYDSMSELEDFIATIYTEVKKRNGIYVLRCETNMKSVAENLSHDLLWTSEEEGENCFTYALPFITFPSFKQEWIRNEAYAHIYRYWKKYLMLYRPMVTENSIVYVNLKDSEEIDSPIPDEVYVSVFVNDETYMVVSNLSDKEYQLNLRELWTEQESGISGKEILVDAGDIILLQKK